MRANVVGVIANCEICLWYICKLPLQMTERSSALIIIIVWRVNAFQKISHFSLHIF